MTSKSSNLSAFKSDRGKQILGVYHQNGGSTIKFQATRSPGVAFGGQIWFACYFRRRMRFAKDAESENEIFRPCRLPHFCYFLLWMSCEGFPSFRFGPKSQLLHNRMDKLVLAYLLSSSWLCARAWATLSSRSVLAVSGLAAPLLSLGAPPRDWSSSESSLESWASCNWTVLD